METLKEELNWFEDAKNQRYRQYRDEKNVEELLINRGRMDKMHRKYPKYHRKDNNIWERKLERRRVPQ